MNRRFAPTTPGSSGRGGRSQRPRGHSDCLQSHVGDGRLSVDDCYSGDGTPRTTGRSSQKKPESNSRYFKHAPGFTYVQERPSPTAKVELPGLGKLKQKQEPADCESTPVSGHKSESPSFLDRGNVKIEESRSATPHDLSGKLNTSSIGKSKEPYKDKCVIQCENGSGKTARVAGSLVPEHLDMGKIQVEESLSAMLKPFGIQYSTSQENSPEKTLTSADPDGSELQAVVKPFDICLVKTGTPLMLKPSLLVKNREKRLENKRALERQNGRILRSGMVILKNYLPLSHQIKIVKKCRELGLGPGGFYQPGYRDGAKLHLKMMCLGKNWDPETSKYDDHRSVDGVKPPAIPHEFCQLVGKAIKDSHAFIQGNSNSRNVEEILPCMSPDICIVNFYTATGRLGLHQDRDESQESLRRGLPVVSFSVGDSAEFLYGEQRDIDKAEKITLESGDLLIFGGKSRHIFHGVTAIIPNTAPQPLLEETNLCKGRLNLTFRKY